MESNTKSAVHLAAFLPEERLEALEKRMAVTKTSILKMTDVLLDLSKAVNILDARLKKLEASQPEWTPENYD